MTRHLAPLPNAVTLGIKISSYKFERDINIQTMTHGKGIKMGKEPSTPCPGTLDPKGHNRLFKNGFFLRNSATLYYFTLEGRLVA